MSGVPPEGYDDEPSLDEIEADNQTQVILLLERIADALDQIAGMGFAVIPGATPQPMPQIPQVPIAQIPQTTLPDWSQQLNSAPQFAPQQGVAPAQPAWVCPIHGQVKTVPAGISRRTNKPYSAFLACPAQGCNEKPPRS